ncbi:MAG: SUMF1/EgtB/PvdO family nonheme iron enzyme, partial [Bdellovibrionales bacterium]|nr:SUMF1/EgtB/PvdO family nonheme iron enzyme [Bdellovibrionales bacterium]
MAVEELRKDLRRYFFELTFFWNEVGNKEAVNRLLRLWTESGLLGSEEINVTLELTFSRDRMRSWLTRMDPVLFEEFAIRYLAPETKTMVRIEGGAFLMGDNSNLLPSTSRPCHQVIVDDYWMAKTMVTWWQYSMFLFATGRDKELTFSQSAAGLIGDAPAILQWYDGVLYCNWLSKQVELEPHYQVDVNTPDVNNSNDYDEKKWSVRALYGNSGFRLPSEAEWEYCCRAGATSSYCFGDGESELENYGWFEANSGGRMQPVARKKANSWGIYDMHGNIWEWCYDWYAHD